MSDAQAKTGVWDGVDGQAAYDVHDRLRDMILCGEFDDRGAFSQVKLAAQLGVSRTPLREAMRMLEREGLIRTAPNRKATVTPISVEDLDELYGARVMLESLAIYISASQSTPADVDELRAVIIEMDRIAEARDRVAWEAPHARFHALLTRHAGPRLQVMTAELRDHSRRYVRRHIAEPRAWEAGSEEHVAIFEAFAARDAARAADRMGVHLARTALTLITQMAPQYNPVSTRGALQFVQTLDS